MDQDNHQGRSVAGVSRHSLLTVYDLLFLFTLHGPRIRRDVVLDYLARATSVRSDNLESRLRAYERLKRHMARLGLRPGYVFEHHGIERSVTTVIVIEDASRKLRQVSALLDRLAAERQQRAEQRHTA